jgi:erythronate-4-phosphate dehydrogenase
VRTRTRCDAHLLAGSRVRFVATATIGYDHIDTQYLKQMGIAWTNCPGCNASSVAQYVEAAIILLAAKGIINIAPTTTIGIVGVGHVGSQVALAARRLGLRTLLCDPPRLLAAQDQEAPDNLPVPASACTASLADVCREADIVSFHTPLTLPPSPHATYHLADQRFFAALRRQPVVINTSRGEAVDEQALIQALDSATVRAAVVDTWEHEPVINRDLLERTFLSTPHIAGYSADGKARGTQMALEAVARFFSLPAAFSILPPSVAPTFRYFPEAPDDLASRFPALALYDPRRDSEALRSDPSRFEQLRGDYPLRRERF